MKITSLDDMRTALVRMAAVNKVSMTTLNDLAKVGSGCLTRFMRVEIRVRTKEGVLTDERTPTDLRLATIIKVVEAAGYELVIQPKEGSGRTRRQQVLDAARQQGDDRAA